MSFNTAPFQYSIFSEQLHKGMPNENRQKTQSQNSPQGNTLVISSKKQHIYLNKNFSFSNGRNKSYLPAKSFLSKVSCFSQAPLFIVLLDNKIALMSMDHTEDLTP